MGAHHRDGYLYPLRPVMWRRVPEEDNLRRFVPISRQPSIRCRSAWSFADHLQPLPKPQALHATEPGAVLPRRWRKRWFSLLRYFWLWCFLENGNFVTF